MPPFLRKQTKLKKAATSVQLHRAFAFESGWVLNSPSDWPSLLAGVILFSFVFKTTIIWVLKKLMLSWSSGSNCPRGSIASCSYSYRGVVRYGVVMVKKSLMGNNCVHRWVAGVRTGHIENVGVLDEGSQVSQRGRLAYETKVKQREGGDRF